MRRWVVFGSLACAAVLLLMGIYSVIRRPAVTYSHAAGGAYTFRWSEADAPYLVKLRTTYGLDGLVAGKPDDYARVQAVTHWVHGLWQHDGSHEPKAGDPISIIEAARQGERFRCTEYSVVLAGALNSLGIPARVLGLKTADVQTRESGAGHVVTEAYLPDRKQWVMLDGQWGAIPERTGVPLSAVEFQQALAEGAADLKIVGDADFRAYTRWIQPYLYYLDAPFDNRVGVSGISRRGLMLVPEGAPEPKVFQRVHPLDYLEYTHSVAAFYPVPGSAR